VTEDQIIEVALAWDMIHDQDAVGEVLGKFPVEVEQAEKAHQSSCRSDAIR
jgi:hypothetical protein